MATVLCAKGHNSTEEDYCSECGVRIEGTPAPVAQVASSPTAYPGEICPDCGTLREQKDRGYCEVCGYNFLTGAHGEIPLEAPSEATSRDVTEAVPHIAETEPKQEAQPSPGTVQGWQITVMLDPALRQANSPEPPADFVSASMDLERGTYLIGRGDAARGIHPEIALPFDEAVSRRHAMLSRAEVGDGWLLRDVGASNGTRLNGREMTPLVDYDLNDGDEITLGHWTRLRLERR